MQGLNLVEVDSSRLGALERFKQIFLEHGEVLYGAPELTSGMSVSQWIEYVELHKRKESLPEGRVLSRTYILPHANNDYIMGLINLRLELNDYLLAYGGHVGYAVSPKYRGRGYATAMLKALVPIASSYGLNSLLITCKTTNIASQRVIERCEGQLEDTRIDPQGEVIRRYWLTGLEC